MFSVTAHCTVITVRNDYYDIWSTTGLVTWVRSPSAHSLHFNCSKLRNRCKSDPCVRIQCDISDLELALELSPEVLTSTLRGWWTLHTERMYPYQIQRMQHLEPTDMCSRLEFCRWINFNSHMICNIFFHRPSLFYPRRNQQYKKLPFIGSW